MFKTFKNSRGQGVTVQYATLFVIVFAVVTAMSVYFKRVVQSRYAGASRYASLAINEIFNSPENYNLTGRFIGQYEPYYAITEMERTVTGRIIDREQGVLGPASIHEREYENMETTMEGFSNQLSPRYGD
ncbi:MAG: hypothetical protein AB1650_04110 [Candidatus Omnitrophota bacterium]